MRKKEAKGKNRAGAAPRKSGPGRRALRTVDDFAGAPAFAPRVEGVLALSRGGTGFVTPDGGGEDVVVPEEAVGAALPGDRVEVRLDPPEKSGARPSGRVVRVVERSRRDVVCTLRRTGRHWTGFPIVPCGGRTFNVEDPKGAADGDRVVLRFSGWDNPAFNPDAEVAGVIGPASDPSLDTLAVERAYDLPREFPPDALEEASRVSSLLGDVSGREDLRGETVVTIDPPSARDFDDALSFSVDARGRRVLGVHIADVSRFVRPGTALDREALRRGTSVYLVDHVLPMLPEQLSNGVCSLVPGEDRLAFSAFVSFDAGGTIVGRRFARTVIRSRRRMTYAEALAVIERSAERKTQDARHKTQDSPATCDLRPATRDLRPATCDPQVADLVRNLHALAQQLRRNRFDRFSLDLASPEVEIDLAPDGRMTGVHPAEHDVAHELVEEAMIAANEAVAMELASRKIPYLSRFHDVPAPEKMEELESALAALGLRTGPLRDAGALKRLLKAVKGTALDYYVSSLVLRSLKRAEYSADKAGHFGLAKRFYLHFTSPIRRYPDLVAHRQLALALAGDRRSQPPLAQLRSVAAQCSKTELRADQAERDLVETKKYRFLAQQLADGRPAEYEAVVVKTAPFGCFVDVPDLMVGGMVHAADLSPHFVKYDRARGLLEAPGLSIGPGSKIRVLVSSVDYEERKISFAFRGAAGKAPRPAPAPARVKPSPRKPRKRVSPGRGT